MFTFFRGVMLLVVFTVSVSVERSHADDAPPAGGAAVDKAPGTNPDAKDAATSTGDKWRYKQHLGLWWYWLPSNSWVYWHDGKWMPYDADSFAKFQTSRAPRRYAYSGSGQQGYSGTAQQGNWGPVRYNQYGQPQYPYSQRKSGIRQLGPVPAMGGIRSLPGWGGER
jgi:hypothetical protein